MGKPLRLLVVEDSEDDALLLLREMMRCGYDVEHTRVDTEEAMREALENLTWDVIASDFSMPRFSAIEALRVLQQSGLDIPFIIISGTIGEDTAVASLKAGAHDFMSKQSLARLAPAIERELREVEVRRSHARAEEELRRKTEELVSMTEQLWQTAKLATVGELTASIAHELNNPLGIMTLRIEAILEQVPLDSPLREELEILEQEVERMGGLVGNLLQFSRGSSRQYSTADIREEITNTVRIMQSHFRSRNIVVIQDFAPDVPTVQADKQLLRQLFMNLFVNACDAMPSGGNLLQRVYPIVVDGKGHVAVEVSDSGTGIPPQILDKIFDPFFSTKPVGKGTGLGLPICRRIVQEHGGTLNIDSGPGRGTTVRIVIPVVPKEAEAAA
jgi:two-component system sensor kinase FixL